MSPNPQAAPSDSNSERLCRCYTGVVHDVMRAMGQSNFTLPPEIRPIIPEAAIAGPAFTIDGEVRPGADAHETLLAWTGLLSQCPAGHIWSAQPNDRIVAHMGELSAETLKNKGVLGCVVDGHWLPRATGIDIRIGEVVIEPGDYLVGDRDGMIRVPKALLSDVLEQSEAAMATESKVRRAILDGVDPQQAYLRYGKF